MAGAQRSSDLKGTGGLTEICEIYLYWALF